MTPEAAAAAAAELRTLAATLEKARAQLASMAELVGSQNYLYTQHFIDLTSAGWHAFSAARICSQIISTIDTAAKAQEENLL